MAVENTRAITDANHRQIVMGDVEFYLFEDPNGDEGTQAINYRPKARPRQTGSHSHHVLFGDAGVDVLSWTLFTCLLYTPRCV